MVINRHGDLIVTTGTKDTTDIYRGKYDGKCSDCWLGFTHTIAAHQSR